MRLPVPKAPTTFEASKQTVMKQNVTQTLGFLLCFGIAAFLNPVSSYTMANSRAKLAATRAEEKPMASLNTSVLHSELLFKF